MSEWDSQFRLRAGIYAFYITLLPTLPTNRGHSVKGQSMKLTLPAGYFLTYKKQGKMSIILC